MFGAEVTFDPDGSCRLTDALMGTEAAWPTVEQWADDWFIEWRSERHDQASEFIDAACEAAVPGVVDALIVLAEKARGDPDLLGWVGAGPLEDLVSHTGNGLVVLPEVDRAARQNPAFRAALRTVWLGVDIPEEVRTRLAELGAQIVGQT